MEAIGAASAILSIATAGVQCSVKLVTFASQIKTAPENITNIAEDVSMNASILQQLGELAKEDPGDVPTPSDRNKHYRNGDNNNNINSAAAGYNGKATAFKQSLFSATGLETVTKLARKCQEIFDSLNESLKKASNQLREKPGKSGMIKLTRVEMLKWPFLKPEMDTMRDELRNAKGTLMLMLQVAMLAYSRKAMGEIGHNTKTTIIAYSNEDQDLLIRSIVATQRSTARGVESVKDLPQEPDKINSNPQRNSTSKANEISPSCDLPRKPSTHPPSPGMPHIPPLTQTPPSPPSPVGFSVHLISPKVYITNNKIHITYHSRLMRLPPSTVESQLEHWKVSSKTTVLDQLLSLTVEEHEALDSIKIASNASRLAAFREQDVLEWIHFGDYVPVIDGME